MKTHRRQNPSNRPPQTPRLHRLGPPPRLPLRQTLPLKLRRRATGVTSRDGRMGRIAVLGRELGRGVGREGGVGMFVGLVVGWKRKRV